MPRKPRSDDSVGPPPNTVATSVATNKTNGGKPPGKPLTADAIELPLSGMGGPEAVQAFLMYRNLGPGRSYAKLAVVW
jgi:hypothetical protein